MVNIKTTSKAIWWIKSPMAAKTNDIRRRKSMGAIFCLDMADLLRNISLHGYNKLLTPELCLLEKLIWLLVHTTTFIAMLTVLSLTWEQFVSQYFVINLKDPLYPVEKVPFPAVSICSNNRLSLRAATRYARELQRNNAIRHELDYYLKRLTYLSEMQAHFSVQANAPNFEDISNFQAILDMYGTWDNETFFDTRRVMKMMTPACEDIVLKCTLGGVDKPCFSPTMFQESLTMYGPCCTFNMENSYKKRDFKNRFFNAELGLTVVLNASSADYLGPILYTKSYIVIIHNPDNYATLASSNARIIFPPHDEETFLAIGASVMDTDIALKSFSAFSRKCYFLHDAPDPEELLHNTYTFSNCITKCRIRSIIALCRCVPYVMPLELLASLDGVIYCTLNHYNCLKQYQFKWWNVLTERHAIPGLEREIEEALYCPKCLPSCDDVQYQLEVRSLPIDLYIGKSLTDTNNETLPSSDISVLHVFFGEAHAKYYIRIMNNTWFEALSTVGNILSIFVGFSLVAIFEILYFLFKYLYQGGVKVIDQHTKKPSAPLNPQELIICP